MTEASAPNSETVQPTGSQKVGSQKVRSQEGESEETGFTWENWLLARLPRSPLLVAVSVLAALVACYLGAQWALGYPPERVAELLDSEVMR